MYKILHLDIACGLARDGLPQEAESLCRLKKKLDKNIEEKIH